MTPEQQRLIDAAAKVQYERLHEWARRNELMWTPWKDLTEEQRERFYAAVIGPVTVALRTAVTAVHCLEALEENGRTYRRAFDDGTSAAEDAISSLIPAQEKTNDA